MYTINCPFCKEKIISDVAEKVTQINGQWQCSNGHTFVLTYVGTIDKTTQKVNKETDKK